MSNVHVTIRDWIAAIGAVRHHWKQAGISGILISAIPFAAGLYGGATIETYRRIIIYSTVIGVIFACIYTVARILAEKRVFDEDETQEDVFGSTVAISLSDDARNLLKTAASTKNGMIVVTRTARNTRPISVGQTLISEGDSQREIARWDSVINELTTGGYINRGDTIRVQTYTVTDQGYAEADRLDRL